MPGAELGRLRVEKNLGAGGFGRSDLAERRADGGLSCLGGQKKMFARALEEFGKKANLLQRLPTHPNQLHVPELFRRNDTSCNVTEFIGREALPAWIGQHRRDGRAPPDPMASEIAADVAAGLAVVNGRGLVVQMRLGIHDANPA
ncbi:serine/threonine protein kinase [Mangrovicoccus sp. HB161399]|uniref:serine/threonine protein kinase n=1 Tax=Mangrovicoccus sp. HB161399 TaxID=2720392 RepID=UPI001556FAE1|nr:serine/threonine protein kinase [Mangrovicoccus sp. HB161399]